MPPIPEAYWKDIPWPVAGILILLSTIGVPFYVAWRKGRTIDRDASRKTLVDRETDLRTRERELYDELEQQRDDLKAELADEREAHRQTQQLVVWWQDDSRRGWGKARWAKSELRSWIGFARDLMQMIESAKLPHQPWPDVQLPLLEDAPELPPDGFQEPRRPTL